MILHFIQLFFYSILISKTWFIATLFGNTLWLLAIGYYLYITFLGKYFSTLNLFNLCSLLCCLICQIIMQILINRREFLRGQFFGSEKILDLISFFGGFLPIGRTQHFPLAAIFEILCCEILSSLFNYGPLEPPGTFQLICSYVQEG